MSIKVATWNAQEHLAEAAHAQEIIDGVLQIDSDVMILPDAMWIDNPLHKANIETANQSMETFHREGYKLIQQVPYDDRPGYWSNRYLLALSRLTSRSSILSLGIDGAADLHVKDDASNRWLRIIGLHASDRSDVARRQQADVIAKSVAENAEEPTVVAGDFNNMHAQILSSKLLASTLVRAAGQLLRDRKPRNQYETNHGRPNKLKRLSSMATGLAMDRLTQQEPYFRDADTLSKPTFPAKRPLMQLDHILLSGPLSSDQLTVHYLAGSDHRAVSAEISL